VIIKTPESGSVTSATGWEVRRSSYWTNYATVRPLASTPPTGLLARPPAGPVYVGGVVGNHLVAPLDEP
jgi:hypothetical protein